MKNLFHGFQITVNKTMKAVFKMFILLASLSMPSCSYINQESPNLEPKNAEASANQAQESDSIMCLNKSVDFLQLKDNQIQSNLFLKIDSIRSVQYPENDQETAIMVDLTPEYLNTFLSDINIDSLNATETLCKNVSFQYSP
jgi:hypothetical protein